MKKIPEIGTIFIGWTKLADALHTAMQSNKNPVRVFEFIETGVLVYMKDADPSKCYFYLGTNKDDYKYHIKDYYNEEQDVLDLDRIAKDIMVVFINDLK